MTPQQRAKYKSHLQRLQQELLQKGPTRIDPNRADEAEVGSDEDDQPLNEMLQSIASDRNRNTSGVLKRIDHALRKLEADPDDFGNCEECGEELPEGRLSSMPYAELCVECQGKRDGKKPPPTRRNLFDFR